MTNPVKNDPGGAQPSVIPTVETQWAENLPNVSMDSDASSLTIENTSLMVEAAATQAEQPLTYGETEVPTNNMQAHQAMEMSTNETRTTESPKPRPTPEERLGAKEAAVIEALAGLNAIRRKIKKCDAIRTDMEIQAWLAQLNSAKADNKKFEFLVGAAGSTGMGKSSLLNALIGHNDDLAPSSQNGACTAAVCCFHYHDSAQAERKYLASVTFKSKKTVDRELEAFFNEWNSLTDDAKLNSQTEAEIRMERERLQETLNLIPGWSGLSKAKILEFGTNDRVSEISKKCVKGPSFFNYQNPEERISRMIGANTARNFLQDIRPYVGNTRKKLATLLWPLVEIVDIYVDAPILRNGVVLVDLPGESDALESRAQVAKNYYNKLDRLMIATPSDRACDNQTAAELMRDEQVLDLEADGKMAGDGLCVVITKIDNLNWEQFVAQECDPKDVSDDMEDMMNRLDAMNGELDELDDLSTEYTQLKQEIKTLKGKCLKACIDARNRDIAERMREGINRRRQDMLGDETMELSTKVNVFPISSHAHRNLLKGNATSAFPDMEATGIPALEQWIRKGSIEKRGRHADSMLNRCQRLSDQIEEWALKEWLVRLRLPKYEYPKIDEVLIGYKDLLRRDLHKWVNDSTELVKMHDKLDKKLKGDVSWKKNTRFLVHIKSFNKHPNGGTMHYASYAACIRRYGGLYKSGARPPATFDWQGSTYAMYWKSHLSYWTRTFNDEILTNRNCISRSFQQVIDQHIERVSNSAGLPEEYRDACKQHMEKLQNVGTTSRASILQAIDGFRTESQEVRQKSKDVINAQFTEAYEEAIEIRGKGMSKKKLLPWRAMQIISEISCPTMLALISSRCCKKRMRISKQSCTRRSKTMSLVCPTWRQAWPSLCARWTKQSWRQARLIPRSKRSRSRYLRISRHGGRNGVLCKLHGLMMTANSQRPTHSQRRQRSLMLLKSAG